MRVESEPLAAPGGRGSSLVDRLTLAGNPARRAVAFLVCLFVLSRAVTIALGFRFDVGWINVSIQNIDPHLLRTHLAQSLWNLHGQPPLWNAFVGLSMKLFPSHWPQFGHLVFFGLGLAGTLAFFGLLLELGIPRRPAAAIAAVFTVSPAVLVYENAFFYDYPTLVLLTVTAWAVARFVAKPSVGRGTAAFGVAAALILLRTIFQLPWLLAMIALLLVACRGNRRTVLVSCAVPLALVLGVIAKNWLMFGVPSTTSWSGMNLARATVVGLPIAERRQLVREGKLHSVSLVKPLSPLSAYEAVGIKPAAPTGIPLLDEASGPSFPRNLENRTFIKISRLYLDDDLWIIEHRPGAYLRSVWRGFVDFFAPATIASGSGGNEGKIAFYDRWFSRIVFGKLGPGKDGLFLIAGYLFAVCAGAWIAVRRLRPGADTITVTASFVLLAILYVGLVGNFAEVGENYRFRLVLDPLALALVALGVQLLWRRRTGVRVEP
jgi:hypothetical protein